MKLFFYLAFALMISPKVSLAAKYVGTIVFSKGDVKIFHANKKKGRKYKMAFYEGKARSYEKARVGKKISGKDVIHCGPKAKAKIVYASGDHFVIGPGSSVTMPEFTKNNKKKPTLDMFYGKVRSMISKKGGFNQLKVKTRAAVAGVRGTDFFISDDGVDKTEITVLRGKVKVQTKKSVDSAVLQSGYKAVIKQEVKKEKELPSQLPQKGQVAYQREKTKKVTASLKVSQAPKKDLLNVQKASQVKVEPKSLDISKEVKAQIVKLEKQATEAVLEDIKIEDKDLYEELKKKEVKSVDEINTAQIAKVFKEAPKAKVKLKATEDDIEELGGDEIYRKYFGVE